MPNLSETLNLLFSILPVMVAGILNMVWVKQPFLDRYKVAMDKGKTLADGKRLWGDNKTWKGFWGMAFFTALTMAGFQYWVQMSTWAASHNVFSFPEDSFPMAGAFIGFILGLTYVLAELPNSYIKRRIDIAPGTNSGGFKGMLFTLVDQADSVIGCALVLPLFANFGFAEGVMAILLATALHLIINFLLFLVGLKRQPR